MFISEPLLYKILFVVEILLILVKSSVEKIVQEPKMLKRFTEAWPRRMDKSTIHDDVHDAVSTLKFSLWWLVY